jgi:hypothetical protein
VATSSNRFTPDPGEPLVLFGETFHVREHPGATGMPHSSEGSRATVYGLVSQKDHTLYAIKLLRRKYRGLDLVAASEKLLPLHDLPGLAAASRRVVSESEPAARRCQDLAYSILIPWLTGSTWFDLLNEARAGTWKLERGVAVALCHRFLVVMAALEGRGAAHTDISPGNVMIDRGAQQIALLDLEDMYLPGAKRPIDPSSGSAGYRHASMTNGASLWHAAGDRYAAAVLAAEILILAEPNLSRLATEQGFFADHYGTEIGRARYALAEPWLHLIAPGFLEIFRRSWYAATLESCPTLAQMGAALTLAQPEIPGFVGWTSWNISAQHTPSPAPTPAPAACAPRPDKPGLAGPTFLGILLGVLIGIVLALSIGGAMWAWVSMVAGLGGLCGLLRGMRGPRKPPRIASKAP